MLLSMTGFGEARTHDGDLTVTAEVRSVNNRYLKINVRAGEGFAALEPKIEGIVREHARRGTIQVDIRIRRDSAPDDYRLNLAVLESYSKQLTSYSRSLSGGAASSPGNAEREMSSSHLNLSALLSLPGVVEENANQSDDADQIWPVVEKTLSEAMRRFTRMRSEEGSAMKRDLDENCSLVLRELDCIAGRAPMVADAYRTRLCDKLNQMLAEHQTTVQPSEIVREVGLFAERCDISEEIVRLRSHVEQFSSSLGASESSGRKLDFVTQEMFREANTIGSKANDSEIARHVIEIKAAVERLREMIQNVE